jgi:hypothetical protein
MVGKAWTEKRHVKYSDTIYEHNCFIGRLVNNYNK